MSTTTSPAGTGFRLTPAQVTYFETFGFLRLPGLFADEAERISRGFEEVFAGGHPTIDTYEDVHYGGGRQIIVGFVDKSDDLRWLLADERVTGVVTSLLGDGWEYCESDGNLMSCDTAWHCDIFNSPLERYHIKLFFYLDPVDADSGALRCIPGSNHYDTDYAIGLRRRLQDWREVEGRFGVPPDEIPSWTVPSQPGDLLVGAFRTIHATFNGPPRRRLFTLNYREALPSVSSAGEEYAAAWDEYSGDRSDP